MRFLNRRGIKKSIEVLTERLNNYPVDEPLHEKIYNEIEKNIIRHCILDLKDELDGPL